MYNFANISGIWQTFCTFFFFSQFLYRRLWWLVSIVNLVIIIGRELHPHSHSILSRVKSHMRKVIGQSNQVGITSNSKLHHLKRKCAEYLFSFSLSTHSTLRILIWLFLRGKLHDGGLQGGRRESINNARYDCNTFS